MADKQKMVCFDSQACIKCFSCVINCAVENRVRLQREQNISVEKTMNEALPYFNYLTVKTSEKGTFPEVTSIAALKHCNHCEIPHCAEICPTKALYKRPDGIVALDQSKCIGCQACKDACPYDIPQFSAETGRSYKCIMCYDRLQSGLPTACSSACPSVAMFSGDAEEVKAEATSRAKKYSETFGKEYIVYGANKVNSHVGSLHYITIAPAEHREEYLLPEDPVSKTSVARDVIKVAAVAGAAVVAGAIGVHVRHWNKHKKDSVYNHKEEE